MTSARRTQTGAIPALLLAVFTVSVGYGVVLPFLPDRIGRVATGLSAPDISRNTGLLTGAYALALFLFAPVWGWLSDRRGRRGTLALGLLGFGGTLVAFAFLDSLVGLYAERFLSGIFASAVTPVATAAIGDLARTETERVRRLTLTSMAGVAGFLVGPAAGALAAQVAAPALGLVRPVEPLASVYAATGLFAMLVALAVIAVVPNGRRPEDQAPGPARPPGSAIRVVPRLLGLAFIVAAAVGVFEVGLALRGKQELGLTAAQIAVMFGECSLVMFVMQAIVFSPWIKPETTRWLVAPALGVLAAGLLLIPRATEFPVLLAAIGGVAGSAGILSPILTYWISATAGSAQGWELGKQTSATSLGVLSGSIGGGLLFNVAAVPGSGFLLTAGLVVVGVVLSLRLPRLLARQ